MLSFTRSLGARILSTTVIQLVLLADPRGLAATGADCVALKTASIAPPADASSLTIDSAVLIAPATGLPEHCQVVGHLDAEINFLLKLPTPWNGKVLMSGNGGFAGSFDSLLPGLEEGLARQYAVVGTDTGHSGPPSVLLNRPDRIANFQYRAVHVVALAAKSIVAAYYGTPASHSYFSSCSTGGRQGMLEAQSYPEDFDGVIAGAPALPNGGFQFWNSRAAFPGSPFTGVLPSKKVYLLSTLVLQKCDALDGLADGIVDDPRRCDFSPSRDLPACANDVDRPACFTRAQIEALDKIHRGPTSNGQALGARYLFSGVEGFSRLPGNGQRPHELDFSYVVSGFPGDPHLYPDLFGIGLPSASYWVATMNGRFIVFGDPTFLLENFDFENPSDVSRFTSALAPQFPSSPDLSEFAGRGGKLITYHGWGDSLINPSITLGFYEAGAQVIGGLDSARAFDRLFMIPGMAHCSDGPGPWSIDPLPALEQWVEQGNAPDFLIGTNPDSKLTRPLCAYHYVARLIHPGLDPNVASSFTCVVE